MADDTDPLLGDAIALVLRQQRATTATLQRGLGIGFQRAARLQAELEAAGIIAGRDDADWPKVTAALH